MFVVNTEKSPVKLLVRDWEKVGCRKYSIFVVGLAPVAGMCTETSSCTVNEGRHFESVYVVAHEIGHK